MRLGFAMLLLAPLLTFHAAQAADIIDTAAATGRFGTFLRLLDAAELTEPIRERGALTLFAPTDAAFGKLPDGEIDRLLRPENRGQLSDLLRRHVIPGIIPAAELARLRGLGPAALYGGGHDIRAEDGAVRVDDATVVAPDIAVDNGVIHGIDAVLALDS